MRARSFVLVVPAVLAAWALLRTETIPLHEPAPVARAEAVVVQDHVPVVAPEPPGPAAPEAKASGFVVTCAIEVPDAPAGVEVTIEHGPMHFVEDGQQRMITGLTLRGVLLGGDVVFVAPQSSGTAWITVTGYEPEWVNWWPAEPGQPLTCDGPPLRPRRPAPSAWWGAVRGEVVLPEGASVAEIWVDVCGKYPRALDEDGTFRITVPIGEPCAITAWRRAGVLSAPGPTRIVLFEPDGPLDVDLLLEVPDHAPAGMGIALDEHPEGVRVLEVYEETPAWDAGMDDGDLIVAIDGIDTAGMSLDEFVAFGVGPEGTEVVLDVLGEDGEHRFTIVREQLPTSLFR